DRGDAAIWGFEERQTTWHWHLARAAAHVPEVRTVARGRRNQRDDVGRRHRWDVEHTRRRIDSRAVPVRSAHPARHLNRALLAARLGAQHAGWRKDRSIDEAL